MIQEQLTSLIGKQISTKDFPEIDKIIQTLSTDLKTGKIAKEDIDALNKNFGQEFLDNTLQGFGLRKPYDYTGDFLMIDKIYTYYKSPIKKYEIWDEYFHRQSAPKAVRNRKEYFKTILKEKFESYQEVHLMNVASGPARDLAEFYDQEKGCQLITSCIESDEHAIKYAKALNKNHLDKIQFVHSNIFKHREKNKYDVIWSAGLFDYFNDKAFIMIIKKFKDWLNPNGEIIIGNFNENYNPSRAYMEIFGEWYLHHRTEDQLRELAQVAGFKANQIHIGKEAQNVNLFLHIKM